MIEDQLVEIAACGEPGEGLGAVLGKPAAQIAAVGRRQAATARPALFRYRKMLLEREEKLERFQSG
ncbi:MAG: hypothetical protein ACREFN_19315 [Acetobacteraceae bacterium]